MPDDEQPGRPRRRLISLIPGPELMALPEEVRNAVILNSIREGLGLPPLANEEYEVLKEPGMPGPLEPEAGEVARRVLIERGIAEA